VTKNVRFILSAVILPLHDPVLIAEQIAITNLVSNGRINVVLGTGYVPSEFAMFGKSLQHRAKLMDTGIETILRALRGEEFETRRAPHIRPSPPGAGTRRHHAGRRRGRRLGQLLAAEPADKHPSLRGPRPGLGRDRAPRSPCHHRVRQMGRAGR
jgi:alkanesulfonate monooxygenase SsuD/methylene tetrahydromethanopterin reductase-like flavin-dependent oxidoreductase (luciferase family)